MWLELFFCWRHLNRPVYERSQSAWWEPDARSNKCVQSSATQASPTRRGFEDVQQDSAYC